MDEQRWKAEEYHAKFEHAIGVIHQFFTTLGPYMNLKENINVLEVGIGSGKWSAAFAIIGCNVVAVDNNIDILNNFRLNFPQISKAILTVQDDVTTLRKIPDKGFDLVFSEGLVEHFLNFEERQNVIINMFSKLNPNGICLCLVPKDSVQDDEITYSSPDQLISDFNSIGMFDRVEGFSIRLNGGKSLEFIGVRGLRGIT